MSPLKLMTFFFFILLIVCCVLGEQEVTSKRRPKPSSSSSKIKVSRKGSSKLQSQASSNRVASQASSSSSQGSSSGSRVSSKKQSKKRPLSQEEPSKGASSKTKQALSGLFSRLKLGSESDGYSSEGSSSPSRRKEPKRPKQSWSACMHDAELSCGFAETPTLKSSCMQSYASNNCT